MIPEQAYLTPQIFSLSSENTPSNASNKRRNPVQENTLSTFLSRTSLECTSDVSTNIVSAQGDYENHLSSVTQNPYYWPWCSSIVSLSHLIAWRAVTPARRLRGRAEILVRFIWTRLSGLASDRGTVCGKGADSWLGWRGGGGGG